ncbi:hypothetical protein BGZ63DRAFT_390960 [Mariannaea sp. PMI_226]|nr:hypothetical protein BGZ63DRAFT_390960 [Mariannaea sp. PMI_226]
MADPDFKEDEDVRAWYLGRNGGRQDIAKAAYEEALVYLRKELEGEPKALAWIEQHTSLDKMHEEASEVEARYNGVGQTKKTVLVYMRKISAWIMSYGQVLDMLSSHHPEYVSLAWGAAKFILMGILNHEKITSQISQALLEISEVLPRSDLHAKLYPTERMKDSMARLYAHLMLFLRQAVKWFSRHSVARAVSSIFKPFELKYKGLVDQIETCAKVIDEEASVACRAEIRGLHVNVWQNGKRIVDLDKKVDETRKAQDERFDAVNTKLEDIRIEIKEIRHRVSDVQVVVGDTRTRVIDLQFNEVMNNVKPKTLPEDSLRAQQAYIRRAMPWVNDSKATLEIRRRLSNWVSAWESPLLILQAGPRAQTNARDLAIEMIEILRPTDMAVIWHLPNTSRQEGETLHRTDILRSLVFQLMTLAPELLSSGAANLDAARFQAQHGEAEWLDLLCLILGQLPRCFLLVEAEEGPSQKEQAQELRLMLEAVVKRCQGSTCMLKAMLLSGNADLEVSAIPGEMTNILTVQKPPPPPPHLRRPRTRQKARMPTWSGVKK